MSGGILLRMLLITVAALCCSQLIRGKTPALALLISLAAILALLKLLLPGLQASRQVIQGLLAQTGLESDLFLPLFKILAITQVTHIAAELCRDAGERAIAAKLELCGAAAALLCVLPLAQQALNMIGASGP